MALVPYLSSCALHCAMYVMSLLPFFAAVIWHATRSNSLSGRRRFRTLMSTEFCGPPNNLFCIFSSSRIVATERQQRLQRHSDPSPARYRVPKGGQLRFTYIFSMNLWAILFYCISNKQKSRIYILGTRLMNRAPRTVLPPPPRRPLLRRHPPWPSQPSRPTSNPSSKPTTTRPGSRGHRPRPRGRFCPPEVPGCSPLRISGVGRILPCFSVYTFKISDLRDYTFIQILTQFSLSLFRGCIYYFMLTRRET